MSKLNKKKFNSLVKSQIIHVNNVLYNGNMLGGKSLQMCLDEYKEGGIYHPCRRDLIFALQRSLEELITLESFAIANGHLGDNPIYLPNSKKN